HHAREQRGDPAAPACHPAEHRRPHARMLRQRRFSDRRRSIRRQARAAVDGQMTEPRYALSTTCSTLSHSFPGAALEGKISDFITTGTAPELGNMVPMSM